MGQTIYDKKESRTHNNTCKKLAVQWLNEALCFERQMKKNSIKRTKK